MYSFCIFLECDSDLNKINNTLNSLAKVQDFQSNGKLVLLFKRKKYMVNPDKLRTLNALLYEKGEHCLGTDEPDEISESIEKDGKDIFFSEVNKYLMETEGLCDITECKGKDEQNISLFEGVECFFGVGYPGKITEIMECIEKDKREILFFVREGDTFDPYCFKYIDSFFKENHETCGVMFIPVLDSADTNLPFLFQKLPSRGVTAFDENFPSDIYGAVVWSECVHVAGLNSDPFYKSFANVLKHIAEQQNLYGRVNKTVIRSSKQESARIILGRKHLISCIIPIYNVEQYLAEAIESVVAQSIGFEENVQLILVNDGSTDGCGEICKKYQRKYPDNVVYIEQENKGVSIARNVGLDVMTGEYVAFLDGDDKYDSTHMQTGFEFLRKHSDEVDLVAFPIQLFGIRQGDHVLNYKHKKITIIDLNKNPEFPQTSCSSTLIRRGAIENLRFKTNMSYCEDGEFAHQILMRKQKYGVLKSPYYFNRKRDDLSSANQVAFTNIDWYNRMSVYFDYLYASDVENFGCLQKYSQFLLLNEMRSLQDRSISVEVSRSIINPSPLETIGKIAQYLEYDLIMKSPLNFWNRIYLLKLKYKNVELKQYDNGMFFCIGSNRVEKLEPSVRVCFIEERSNVITIIGFFSITDNSEIELICIERDNVIVSELTDNIHYGSFLYGENVQKSTCFELNIPCEFSISDSFDLKFYVRIPRGWLFPVKLIFENKCTLRNRNFSFTLGENSIIRVTQEKNILNVVKLSQDVLESAINKYLTNFKAEIFSEAIAVIKEYFKIYPFLSKDRIWLFLDRPDSADDNAEYLFKYSVAQSDGVKKFFVIDKNSSDFSRLNECGNIVPFGSKQHMMLFMFAEKIISSQTMEGNAAPFSLYNSDLWDIFSCVLRWDLMYLQHGLIKDNLSSWLNRLNQNIKLFVSASRYEYESLINDHYHMTAKIVKLLGFPRFDSLKDNSRKRIIFMPTWRKSLSGGIGVYSKSFKNSLLCEGINSLMNDDRFISFAKDYGYEILFRPHPRMFIQKDDFSFDPFIKISPIEESYQVLYKTGSILITDYSSAMFDFAYLKKPVLYYQYCEPNLEKGYWDDEAMGFGEIVTKQDELVDLVISYIENGCSMKALYKKRVDDYFAFTDRNNCKRVYEAIMGFGRSESM